MSTDADTSIRATKRKLDDAFQTLDEISVSPSTSSSAPPLKRAHTSSSSIYSTLSKYGIKPRQQQTNAESTYTKNTPHLSAILSRVASKAKKATTISRMSTNHDFPTKVEYRPSSTASFLDRLSTYTLSNYGNKSSAIDAVAASKAGWTNNGKDRLYCGICGASWVVAGRTGLKPEAANTLVEKQRLGLVSNHKSGCPWKAHQCDDSIYQIPHRPPKATIEHIRQIATILQPVMEDLALKHPLTEAQLSKLCAAVAPRSDSSQEHETGVSETLSDSAIVVSLFGWEPASDRARLASSASISRSASRPITMPSTPSLSRSQSAAATLSAQSLVQGASGKLLSKEKSLLQCSLCYRRVGLWTFGSSSAAQSRPFDVLHEHRSYCPYVVKSGIQSMSGLSSTELEREGWKQVLAVCIGYGEPVSGSTANAPSVSADPRVESMLHNAKSHSSSKVLQYVKDLLK